MTIKQLIIKLLNDTDIQDLDEELEYIKYEKKEKDGYELEIKTVDK